MLEREVGLGRGVLMRVGRGGGGLMGGNIVMVGVAGGGDGDGDAVFASMPMRKQRKAKICGIVVCPPNN